MDWFQVRGLTPQQFNLAVSMNDLFQKRNKMPTHKITK